MKTLYLVRHAKSSWDDPTLPDFDRPLNGRGKVNAPFMGKLLKERQIKIDLILSSSAKRAKKTAEIFAKELNYDIHHIVFEESIYEASVPVLLQLIQKQDDAVEDMMLFGHNPSLTDFVNLLTDSWIDNIPTTGVCAIHFQIKHWQDIKPKSGTLHFFEYPKKHLL